MHLVLNGLGPADREVSVPVRGMDCIAVVSVGLVHLIPVSVPVRGMDCIFLRRPAGGCPWVSVPVRGMDCIQTHPVKIYDIFAVSVPVRGMDCILWIRG